MFIEEGFRRLYMVPDSLCDWWEKSYKGNKIGDHLIFSFFFLLLRKKCWEESGNLVGKERRYRIRELSVYRGRIQASIHGP